MEKVLRVRRGFAIVKFSFGLVTIGFLVGAALGGVQMFNNVKFLKQVEELQELNAVVYTYYNKFQKLPGDSDTNGEFDSDEAVWADLESQNMALKKEISPYGDVYSFGFVDASMKSSTHRQGNFISVSLPPEVAGNIDTQIDDGLDDSGLVTSSDPYSGSVRVMLYYFIY